MRTLEYTIKVEADGKLTLNLPADVPPGNYELILVIADKGITATAQITKKINQVLDVHMIEWDTLPENTNFSREELYDDIEF